MSTMDEIILLTDEFTGLEYSWRKLGAADSLVNNVLTKNIGNYKYERIFEVADVRWWGVKGDGTDESSKLNQMLLDIQNNKKVNEVAFYGLESVIVESTLEIKRGDLIIDGKNCVISANLGTDILIFNIDNTGNVYKANNIHIKNFVSGNYSYAQTFLKAKSSNNLRITDCRIDGLKLGLDLYDCLFAKMDSILFHATYQAFKLNSATNAFQMTNVAVYGTGIPSEITGVLGGNISGCSFEEKSGALIINDTNGINITGNYFEGYEAVDTYITVSLNAGLMRTSGINISGNLFYKGAKNSIMLNYVRGISITGNTFGTLHAVLMVGDGVSTQRQINYSGNAWSYDPSSPTDNPSEFTGDAFDQGRANISPEWNVPVIFTPQVFHGRYFENGEHQIGATAIDANFTTNYLVHNWQVNGKKINAQLNGSVELISQHFEPNEILTIDFEPFAFGCTTGTLIIHNSVDGFAMFLWHRNVNNLDKTGYFQEIFNNLGVDVIHHDGALTFGNGSTKQFLKAELKV